MPVDYSKYPLDWFSRIRPMILQRARHCCEECRVPNYSIITRNDRQLIWENDSFADAKKALQRCHTSDRTDGFIAKAHTSLTEDERSSGESEVKS